ncbi:sulfotransferase [Thiohalophilus sp.]|uniref:sulfotransferase family protein n=1 Tax=Thiohalophilus sp. TaxID=3028392 RepID=UPI002ACD87B1|nr:sulfotransferase [Thiohalophilus sp.]MDZ7662814.1 sulfotransferase [Thiohalophilus sp.]
MKKLLVKWERFCNRNEGRILRALRHDLISRLYMLSIFRRTIHFIVPVRYPRRWAFVVGCYNSGTTLLREMLGSHPSIATLEREGVKFTEQFPDLQSGGWQRMLLKNRKDWKMPRSDMQKRTNRIISDWSPMWKNGREIFLEKSIEHSVRLEWLEEAFDSPYFITIVRNGYCVSEGIRRKAAPSGPASTELGSTKYPVSLAAEQWVAINEKIDEQIVNLHNVYSISYEELVMYPIQTLEKLFSFLGLNRPKMSFKDGVLEIESNTFKIKNMNPESYARLSSTEINEITDIMRDKLQYYGYLSDWKAKNG